MATDGGRAFPAAEKESVFIDEFGRYEDRLTVPVGGMSMRDYFAAAALPAVIDAYLAANGNGCAADHALRNVPALAFKYADAMLAERAK